MSPKLQALILSFRQKFLIFRYVPPLPYIAQCAESTKYCGFYVREHYISLTNCMHTQKAGHSVARFRLSAEKNRTRQSAKSNSVQELPLTNWKNRFGFARIFFSSSTITEGNGRILKQHCKAPFVIHSCFSIAGAGFLPPQR